MPTYLVDALMLEMVSPLYVVSMVETALNSMKNGLIVNSWYFVNNLGDGICQFGQNGIPFTPECGCEGGDCGEVVNGECVPCELDFFNVCV